MSERLTGPDLKAFRIMADVALREEPADSLAKNFLRALDEVDALRAELTTAKQTAEDRRQAIMDLHDDRDRGWGAGRR